MPVPAWLQGPATYHNCPSVRYNGATSWPVQAGHGCVGCSEPDFWDTMTPFYDRLPHVETAGLDLTADRLGVAVVAATAAGFALHGVGKAVQHRVAAARDARMAQVPAVTRADPDSGATGPAGDRSPGGGGHDGEAEDGQEL